MSYQQLTEGKRYQIAALVSQGLLPSDVARIIHNSSLYGLSGVETHYRAETQQAGKAACPPTQAHALIQQRRHSFAKYRVPQDTIDFIDLTLPLEWSPEQISGMSQQIGMPTSHEWIGQCTVADKARGRSFTSTFAKAASVTEGG